MKTLLTFLFSLTILSTIYCQNNTVRDSVKKDTVYIHNINTNDNKITIDKNSYDQALDIAKSTIENLKWLLLVFIGVISGAFTWIKYRDDKRIKESINSFEKKLIDSQDKLNEKVKEISVLEGKIVDNYKKYENLMDKFEEVDKKFNKLKDEMPMLELKIENSITRVNKEVNLSQAYRMLELGNIKFNEKNFKEAYNNFDQAINYLPNDDPRLSEAYNGRGSSNYRLDNYNLAIEDIKHAISLKPNVEQYYNILANVYSTLNNFSEAISNYSKSISLNNKSSILYINRGTEYVEDNDLEKGIIDLNIGQSLAMDNSEKAYAYIGFAVYFGYQGNETECIRNLENASQLNPSRSFYLTACSYAFLFKTTKKDEYKSKALQFLKEGIENKTLTLKRICISHVFEHLKNDKEFIDLIGKCS